MSKEIFKEKLKVSKGIARGIRTMKGHGEGEKAEELRKRFLNRPDQIKKREDGFFEFYFQDLFSQEELEWLREISPEKAKEKLGEKEDFDFKKFFIEFLMEVYEHPLETSERDILTREWVKTMYFVYLAYPEKMKDLFTVDGTGKTNFDKWLQEVRRLRP